MGHCGSVGQAYGRTSGRPPTRPAASAAAGANAADAADDEAVGTGTGSGAQVLSHGASGFRLGSLPLARYAAMVPSTQRFPKRESACDVPPGSASSTEFGKSLRTSRLPVNGVAASSVSSISRALLMWLPLMWTGCDDGAGQ
jgi:hypothetical protein